MSTGVVQREAKHVKHSSQLAHTGLLARKEVVNVWAQHVKQLPLPAGLPAQPAPRLTGPIPLTNHEMVLSLTLSNGPLHRLDFSTRLPEWSPLITLPPGGASLQHTDTAAPYAPRRFYRLQQLSTTNDLTGVRHRLV